MPVPVHRGKHNLKPLFSGKDLVRYLKRKRETPAGRVPDRVVLLFGRRLRAHVLRRYGAKKVASVDDFGLVWIGRRTAAAFLHLGAPYAGVALEELIAHGARRFLAVGTAGALGTQLKTGDLVLCTRAIRDEGTSHHYVKPSLYAYPTPRLLSRLRATLIKDRVSFCEGPTWTTDAPYRETIPEIKRYRRLGALTVEMEAAAIFAVAARLGAEAAALFAVSDHLDESGWEPRFADVGPSLELGFAEAIKALA